MTRPFEAETVPELMARLEEHRHGIELIQIELQARRGEIEDELAAETAPQPGGEARAMACERCGHTAHEPGACTVRVLLSKRCDFSGIHEERGPCKCGRFAAMTTHPPAAPAPAQTEDYASPKLRNEYPADGADPVEPAEP